MASNPEIRINTAIIPQFARMTLAESVFKAIQANSFREMDSGNERRPDDQQNESDRQKGGGHD